MNQKETLWTGLVKECAVLSPTRAIIEKQGDSIFFFYEGQWWLSGTYERMNWERIIWQHAFLDLYSKQEVYIE